MGQATVYCEKCGEMIPEQDFAKGKAVHHEGKNYCANCRGEVAHLLPQEAPSSGSGVSKTGSGVFKSTASPYPSVRRVSGVFQPQAVGKASVSGAQKRTSSGIRKAISAQVLKPVTPAQGQKTVDDGETTHPHPHSTRPDTSTRARKKAPGFNPLVIVGIVGGLLVLGGIIFFAMQSAKKSAEAQKARDRQRKAKEAVEEVQDQMRTAAQNFDMILTAIDARRSIVKGEKPYDAELAGLEEQIRKQKAAFEAQKANENKLASILSDAQKDPLSFKDHITRLNSFAKELTDAPAEFVGKVKQETVRLREVGIRAHIADAVKQAQAPRPKYQHLIDTLSKLRDQAEDQPHMVKEIDAEIETIKRTRDEGAGSYFKKLSDEVYTLLDGKRFDDALKRVDEFPEEYHETKHYPELLRLRTTILRRKEEHARGVGSGGSGGHDDRPNPPVGGEIQLFNGEDRKGWNTRNDANGTWNVDPVEKSLRGENTQVGAVTNERLLWIFKGEREWADLDLTFESRILKGDGFHVAVRVGASGSDVIRFQTETQRWQTITVEYRGSTARIRMPNGQVDSLGLENRSPSGFVGFGIEPGGLVEFRNIRVKVVSTK